MDTKRRPSRKCDGSPSNLSRETRLFRVYPYIPPKWTPRDNASGNADQCHLHSSSCLKQIDKLNNVKINKFTDEKWKLKYGLIKL